MGRSGIPQRDGAASGSAVVELAQARFEFLDAADEIAFAWAVDDLCATARHRHRAPPRFLSLAHVMGCLARDASSRAGAGAIGALGLGAPGACGRGG